MTVKLFDSELKVMNVVWEEGDITAKQISDILVQEVGWNKNTTYTVIKKCIAKGALERREPNFLCHALIGKEEVQQAETEELIGKLFNGSTDKLFAALLGSKKLTAEEVSRLRKLVDDLDTASKEGGETLANEGYNAADTDLTTKG